MDVYDLLPNEDEYDTSLLTIAVYTRRAARTDQFKTTKYPADLPLLGLAGEIGSLVAEVKKLERGDKPNEAYLRAVREELGDCLCGLLPEKWSII